MIIQKLDRSSSPFYFREIAKIHINEIQFGFLPLLGQDFLSTLYSEMVSIPKVELWVAEETDRVWGFILGTSDFRSSSLYLLRKKWLILLLMGIRSIFKKDVIKKIPTILLYPFRTNTKNLYSQDFQKKSSAELLSIAISKEVQGKGFGKLLVLTFEKALIQCGYKGYYFVTTNTEDPKSNAFYKKMGFFQCGIKKHNDLVLQVYKKEIPVNELNLKG